ncbi:transglutaminase-like cysteine peptidase [Bradyrhizobium sp. SSUT112]|uniref:transglutaminase-like cysteine peptidase n=1 Tax=Bradyrhizobium sp. SSUT112 TaxID=3040604 RepID=UPI00244D2BC2|nr:transglutaminase-like cysteine peptidase [Bradyrhizobium sp. SSUT112]MDH2357446.1 transglutaminase-like cysteine peptidase [Bradyrhizobium sp. SSUT112]
MRRMPILAAIAATAIVIASPSAHAGLLGAPIGLLSAIQRIKFEAPALAPMAHTIFCLRYEDECRARLLFRGGPILLTEARWADLKDVNLAVNRAIIPERNELGLTGETWLIDPERGDCNDYAVTKRHRLLERGWPARTLLLGEVVIPSGEHHLVLLVRTKSGDLVLDNLTPQIRPWPRAPYRWVRIQSPGNPRHWTAVAQRGV